MNLKGISFAIIIGVMFFSAYPEPAGRWYKPFNGEAFSYVWDIFGTENRLWFTAENGIGYMDVSTRKTTFFSYHSMGIQDIRYPSFICGDSTRVSLYTTSNIGQISILQYNGTSWMRTDCPEEMNASSSKIRFNISTDNSGMIWVNDGRKMLRYNGSSWMTIDDSVFNNIRYVYTANDNGGLFVAIGDPNIYDTITLAQFDGTQFTPMATLNEYPRYTGFVKKDRNGSFWIYGRTGLYMISADNRLTTYSLDTAHIRIPCPMRIDNSGNLWTTWKDSYGSSNNPLVIRYELSTGNVQKMDCNDYIHSMALCSDGLYYANQDDGTVFHFGNNDTKATTFTLTKPDSRANFFEYDNLLFCKNGSIVRSFQNSVVIYDSSSCKVLPPLHYAYSVIENRDGTLYASNESDTLYVFDGNKWTPDQVFESGSVGSLVFDHKNMLWGLTWDPVSDNIMITHQTDKGWELIDTNNSNLKIVTSSLPDLYVASDGGIWLDAYDAGVARTLDGYTWTHFDSTNRISPRPYTKMYLDRNGVASFIFESDCISEDILNRSCGSIVRKKFINNSFSSDTLIAPVTITDGMDFFEDSVGEVWVTDFTTNFETNITASTLYRHTSSGWIKYDSSNTSFVIRSYIGEDAHGRIYFNDQYNETVVFDPYAGNSRVVNKSRLSHITPVGCFVSGRVLSVDYTVEKPQTMELALYTAQGKRILQVKSNEKHAGMVRKKLPLNVASGLYILKITAPGYTQSVQVLVH